MKRRSRDRKTRVQRAEQAISHLENIILDTSLDLDIRNSAAEDIFRTCMRHNRTIPESVKAMICRECKGILVPSKTARIRIRDRIRITTCLICSRTRRLPLIQEELI